MCKAGCSRRIADMRLLTESRFVPTSIRKAEDRYEISGIIVDGRSHEKHHRMEFFTLICPDCRNSESAQQKFHFTSSFYRSQWLVQSSCEDVPCSCSIGRHIPLREPNFEHATRKNGQYVARSVTVKYRVLSVEFTLKQIGVRGRCRLENLDSFRSSAPICSIHPFTV